MVTKENVAIIIPFHKNIEMLRLSIHTLEESIIEEKPQIIIIANNNDFDEVNLPKDEFDRYDVYKIPENLFWPGAINFGAHQTEKNICFL